MAAVSSDPAVAAEEMSASATATPLTRSRRVSAVVIPIVLAVEVGWLAALAYALWSLT